jgi:hypothetical protein
LSLTDSLRKKDLIRKSLSSTGSSEAINNYCNEGGKSWTDLPLEEASELIEKNG